MRDLEKGRLLAEIIDSNNTTYDKVEAFVAWIRNQECYELLLTNMKEVKKSTSFYARYLYQEFISIDLSQISSIEDGFIAYAKILYLSQVTTPNLYVNPLLVINKAERKIKLKDVLVKFNNRYMTLEEFSKDPNYGFNEKYEFIVLKVKEWQKDIQEKILYPMEKLKDNPRNLPKLHFMPIGYIILGIFYLLCIGILFYSYLFARDEVKNAIWKVELTNLDAINYFAIALISFTLIGIVVYFVELIIRIIRFAKYKKERRILIKGRVKVLDEINKSSKYLENHIVNSIDKQLAMEQKVFSFSHCYYLFEYIIYLYHVNYRCKKIKKQKISWISKAILLLNVLWFALFTLWVVIL